MNSSRPTPPADQAQRILALDPSRSVLVKAPAGSGKTDLLTRRFLRLLSEVEDPAQIVAITFTKAAAAEMRNRILSELEIAAGSSDRTDDEFAMNTLARRALERSQLLGWNLLDLPGQFRISTIDSFCRELALQQPLLSGLGADLDIAEQPADLYRRAARATLEQIDGADPALSSAIGRLLLWRDNGWQEMENLLIVMLQQRDRWMQEFVLNREPDWDSLRSKLERPFVHAIEEVLNELGRLLNHVPGACNEAMELARFACVQSGNVLHRELAELADFPCGPFTTADEIEEARQAHACLAQLLLTSGGAFRRSVDIRIGFPPDRKAEKQRILALIDQLKGVPGLEQSLSALCELPRVRYTEDEWQIVQACFALLRRAVGHLQVALAEAGRVDFIEIAQRAQLVLMGEDQLPTDAAIALADGIRHLLVDEFQDTSRRQHTLIASLVAAWPDTIGRTVFLVGDPMQSIYFFRDADAELFPRVQSIGLELRAADPHQFDFVPLTSNFRTVPDLVETINTHFAQIFANSDGSGINFSRSESARTVARGLAPSFDLHLAFVPQSARGGSSDRDKAEEKEAAIERRDAVRAAQITEITTLICSDIQRMEEARLSGNKYRIAVLGRTRSALAPIAKALREASIPFRAIDLEPLADRPEVLDALALAKALFNPEDRIAWLSVLRAPWCGLSLIDLHQLTSADDPNVIARRVPDLLTERIELLSDDGQAAIRRLLHTLESVPANRAARPSSSLGTWLEQVWRAVGGADCVDATAQANLSELWSCLDQLPNGETDLLGRGLDAALQKLTAQADPAASSDCGVQLMTIHKAKGLEFEVVIVPELQAGSGRGRGGLLSWLERGLAHPDESGEITEFLVAPLQPKGEDRGKAKEWVDRVYRRRESQETRRILYVAATRAREELHLFARPTFKTDKNGELVLCEPSDSLLSTAWPALETEVMARFEEWKQEQTREEAEVASIAASAGNVLVMQSPAKPTLLRRLPSSYQSADAFGASHSAEASNVIAVVGSGLYGRHEGSMLSRALGTAVHSFFEHLARLRVSNELPEACEILQNFVPRIAAQVRAVGVEHAHASHIATKALDITLNASRDGIARWILCPHESATSEVRWAGIIDGSLRTIQVDRAFRAGIIPLSEGDDAWWIIDYKTTHADDIEAELALPQLRPLFSPQLELYAQVLRMMHGNEIRVLAGLYYPRMLAFDSWEL